MATYRAIHIEAHCRPGDYEFTTECADEITTAIFLNGAAAIFGIVDDQAAVAAIQLGNPFAQTLVTDHLERCGACQKAAQ